MRMIFPQILGEFTHVWEGIKIDSMYLMKRNQRLYSFVD